jgi:hypothetical protein
MTHQKMFLFRSKNSPVWHQKISKRGFVFLHLTHQMTLQKDVLIPEHIQHSQVPKILKKRLTSLHLTHQMTHYLTHHLDHKSVPVSLLAEMAVAVDTSGLFNKNYSTRFLPLLTSPANRCPIAVYKMAVLTGMVHSLNFTSSTI